MHIEFCHTDSYLSEAPERWHNPFARLRDDNIANQQTSKRATNIKNAQIKGKSGSCDVCDLFA